MKKLLMVFVILTTLILTGCLTNGRKVEVEPEIKVEDIIIENAYKGFEVQNETYKRVLGIFEKSETIPLSIKRSIKRSSSDTDIELVDKVNKCFDELDKIEITGEDEVKINQGLEPALEYFENNMPKPIENVFGDNIP